MNWLLTEEAFAQAAAATPKQPSIFELLAMPLGFLFILYFFMFRPQQKRAKDQATLISGLKPGDEVYTTSGIIGKIRSVADSFVSLEVSGNVTLKVLKSHISGLSAQLEKKAPEKAPAQVPAKAR